MKNSSWKNEERADGMRAQRSAEEADQDGCGSSGSGGHLIKINVYYGPSLIQISLPSQSTFGYMKDVIAEQTSLEAKQQKLLFRGKEKEDGEYLYEAGVKDNSKVLIMVDPSASLEKKPEVIKINAEAEKCEEEKSKACKAITQVREEVDKLAERVSALQVSVNSGTRVADEEFVVSSELLMRQLLKLDTIEAQGEAKMLRKAEVRRVQNFHEVLDNLKMSNSKPFANNSNAVSVTTEWETFDSSGGNSSSSSTRITQDWERFD